MSRAMRWVIGLGLLTALACTSANEQALAKMSSGQRAYLGDKIGKIEAGMSERQVNLIMGPPRQGAGTPRVCYDPPKDGSRGLICVKYKLYKAAEVEWREPGEVDGFLYVVDLSEEK